MDLWPMPGIFSQDRRIHHYMLYLLHEDYNEQRSRKRYLLHPTQSRTTCICREWSYKSIELVK